MRIPHSIPALALALSLVACDSTGGGGFNSPLGGTGATVGTLGGAAAGGLLGSQIGGGSGKVLATIAGTLAGGFLGNRLGASFDERSRTQAAAAERQAVATNQPTRWSNPDNNASGQVQPTRTFTDAAGRTCREFQTVVSVEGRNESGLGTACRQPDGSWTLVNEQG